MSAFWDALVALSAAESAAVVTIASIYAYSQVREARASRHLTSLLSFQEKYHSPEAREFRKDLLSGKFGAPDEFDADSLASDDYHRFWRLLDQLEVLGVLVEKKMVDFDLVMKCFHRSPPMVWAFVQPYIYARRELASPLESVYLEKLVNRYRLSPALPGDYWDRLNVV